MMRMYFSIDLPGWKSCPVPEVVIAFLLSAPFHLTGSQFQSGRIGSKKAEIPKNPEIQKKNQSKLPTFLTLSLLEIQKIHLHSRLRIILIVLFNLLLFLFLTALLCSALLRQAFTNDRK